MPEKKPDRRVRRTRALLRQALTELLKTKDVRSITVQELAELADVNRGTFYAHYRDVYDMVEKMEQELLDEMNQLMDDYDTQRLRGDLAPVLTDVFRFVAKNRDLLPIFLERQSTDHFLLGLNKLIFEHCLGRWSGLFGLSRDRDSVYRLEFVVSGMVGLVRVWIQTGFRETPEKMGAITGQLIQSGLGAGQPPKA